jgi:hypothetical protein
MYKDLTMAKQPLYKKAFRILEKYGIWWETFEDAREHASAGDLPQAKDFLTSELEFKPKDADFIVDWLKNCIHGQKVELVEIPISEIYWFQEHEMTDDEDEDPFKLERYLARRGVDIAYMETSGSAEDNEDSRKVWFKSKMIDATQLDQVWKIVPVEPAP